MKEYLRLRKQNVISSYQPSDYTVYVYKVKEKRTEEKRV